jgi:hypothetical protein
VHCAKVVVLVVVKRASQVNVNVGCVEERNKWI